MKLDFEVRAFSLTSQAFQLHVPQKIGNFFVEIGFYVEPMRECWNSLSNRVILARRCCNKKHDASHCSMSQRLLAKPTMSHPWIKCAIEHNSSWRIGVIQQISMRNQKNNAIHFHEWTLHFRRINYRDIASPSDTLILLSHQCKHLAFIVPLCPLKEWGI